MQELEDVPIVDLTKYLNGQVDLQECQNVFGAFEKFGVLVVKDPRVKPEKNDQFLDMMEQYYQKRSIQFYNGEKVDDVFPEHNFQTGATPEKHEIAKDHTKVIQTFLPGNEVTTPQPPPADEKWRYFWKICETGGTKAQDNIPQTIPKDFENFEVTMDSWGRNMIEAIYTVSEMIALGVNLNKSYFTDLLNRGPHLLAPTGSDLNKPVGSIFAGFHYDFNFLTIHGKSRYPGLFAWTKNGQRFTVKVPDGHLLIQSGKQFEFLTGGVVKAGFHEVIYTQAVKDLKDKNVAEGKIPWRISSTMFSHIRGDVLLQPIEQFRNPTSIQQYPPISAFDHMMEELTDINLAGEK